MMMTTNHRILLLLFACAFSAILASSCSVGPDYKRPDQHMPATYKSATTRELSSAQLTSDWWKLFGDPTLNELEGQATTANPDILAVMARVEQARAAYRIADSAFYPVISLDPSWTRSRTPINPSASSRTGRQSITITNTRIPFDLTYEVDIWGRVRRASQAARAQFQATADDYHVVMQTLQADLATDYLTLRSLDAQDQTLEETTKSYREQLSLTQTQLRAGLVGPGDPLQAEATLSAALADQLEVKRQRQDLEHAIAILTGRPPGELSLPFRPLDLIPPTLPAGLPADLLRNRPDVAEAEQNLIAASANIGVATADFYPTVTLTGDAGFESFDTRHALNWQNRIWSIGPNVSFPLFEGGRLSAQFQQAKARYTELASTYRSSVLGAIRDVEDSLTNLHLYADASLVRQRAAKASRDYLGVIQTQYRKGIVGYFQVIDAERTYLSNELLFQQILNQRMTSTVLLIKSLGGGWNSAAPAPATTQPLGP